MTEAERGGRRPPRSGVLRMPRYIVPIHRRRPGRRKGRARVGLKPALFFALLCLLAAAAGLLMERKLQSLPREPARAGLAPL